MLLTFSQSLTLEEAFETVALMHENQIRTEFDGAFCQKFKLLVDRFSLFFPKRRKSVEKVIHRKKNWGHRTSKIVKSRQSSSNGHLTYHLFIL